MAVRRSRVLCLVARAARGPVDADGPPADRDSRHSPARRGVRGSPAIRDHLPSRPFDPAVAEAQATVGEEFSDFWPRRSKRTVHADLHRSNKFPRNWDRETDLNGLRPETRAGLLIEGAARRTARFSIHRGEAISRKTRLSLNRSEELEGQEPQESWQS
jgi:hypothetical protein